MKARVRFCLAVGLSALVVVPVAFATGSGGGSAAPLTGETLITSELGDPGTSEVSGTCNPLGTSTFTFEVTGVAFGPYPGTFTESGTMSFGPFGVIGEPIFPASYDATFTINSPAGTVTGDKHLKLPALTGRGLCGEAAFEGAAEDAVLFEGDLTYTARIGGKVIDRGDSFVSYSDLQVRGVADVNGFAFDESFLSTDQGDDDDDDEDDDEDD